MTIAQIFINSDTVFKDYDFKARMKRRSGSLDTKIASQNLLLMKHIFDSYDVKFTLLFGTVLGAVRQNSFIEHDTDTDTGIFEEDRGKLIEAIPTLLENGFDIIRTKYPDDLVTFMKDDEYIDVGIFRLTKKYQKEYYVYQENFIDRDFLDDLDKISFLGEEFNIPKNVGFYLRKTYGSDWHIPRKNEPALDIGTFNIYYRLKRLFLRTKAGLLAKKLIGRKF